MTNKVELKEEELKNVAGGLNASTYTNTWTCTVCGKSHKLMDLRKIDTGTIADKYCSTCKEITKQEVTK